MHRGGGLGEGTDDLGPRRARRGRHRREAEEATEARHTQGAAAEPERYERQGERLHDQQTERGAERPVDVPREVRGDRTADFPRDLRADRAADFPRDLRGDRVADRAADLPRNVGGGPSDLPRTPDRAADLPRNVADGPSGLPRDLPQEPPSERRPGRAGGRRRGPGPRAERLEAGSGSGGRVGVTYKYFGAPDGATAARVPISMRPEELGGDELGMNGMFTKIKPETMAAMVLTGIEGIPLHKVPPLELVVLHPDYAVVKLPMTVVDPLRGIGEEAVGAAAFIWSTVPDRGGPRDAFNVYRLLHEWQDFSHRLHEAGHQAYCLVWP
ncbi:hypothetical protein Shyhy01_62310 [Streptomyces hygroscopicus subsp. hygroscopicus]|nr:hypothetical protein Shyhy01_62310 [Streptomyces hygroscopicus subsp. hygroscopicus]